MELLFKIIATLNALTFLFALVEYLYSKYKKDGVHYFYGTANNTINGLIIKFVLGTTASAYFAYIATFSTNRVVPTGGFDLFLTLLFGLLIYDFFYFFFHWSHHYFDFLWALHHVHHSDKHFNLTASYRFPWLEKIYNSTTCLPLIILGFNPYVTLLVFSIHTTWAFTSHCQYLKFPKFVNYILLTPSLHAVHHDQDHLNKNYGIFFPFWDRLFGTYEDKLVNFTPGIRGVHEDNFIIMQINPLVEYFKKVIRYKDTN